MQSGVVYLNTVSSISRIAFATDSYDLKRYGFAPYAFGLMSGYDHAPQATHMHSIYHLDEFSAAEQKLVRNLSDVEVPHFHVLVYLRSRSERSLPVRRCFTELQVYTSEPDSCMFADSTPREYELGDVN